MPTFLRPPRPLLPAALLLSALPFLPAAARATDGGAAVAVDYENDLFGRNDRHYTNGIRLSYQPSDDRGPDLLARLAGVLDLFPQGAAVRGGYSLSQTMYTPADIDRRDPDPRDRPYAGWLSVAASLSAVSGPERRRLDQLELSLGVVGPWSLAAEAQDLVHRVRGIHRPQGWHAQLGNEPALVLAWARQWRLKPQRPVAGLELDLLPRIGATVGNLFDLAAAGAIVRIGRRLDRDDGPTRIRPSLPGSDYIAPGEPGLGWYLFVGVEARAVARNLFLDGNSFRHSASVPKRWGVGDVEAGAVATLGGWRIGYTHVLRSPEFRGQKGPDHFGTIHVSLRF
jgi:hypothetical protein